MKKHLAYYENEWPANIAELTAVENKPFVGYLKGEGVSYTVIPKAAEGPANNEIWYSTIEHEAYKSFDAVGLTGDSEMTVEILPYDTELDRGILRFSKDLSELQGKEEYSDVADMYICTSYFRQLTSILLPDSIKTINEYTFFDSGSLISVNIPDSVTSIGRQAFQECSSLTSIVIPNSVTSIGNQAFYDCFKLTSITFEGTIEQWNNINKGSYWTNSEVPATYVQCTDGQVAL